MRLKQFLKVTINQYGKAFGLPATPVAILVSGINTSTNTLIILIK